MLNSLEKTTHLLPGEQQRRRDRNREYMMGLKTENLLLAHYLEAGLKSFTHKPEGIHWGWDSPLSEIRGTLVGHWLSAAAHLYCESRDKELKAKADTIVSEIARCQKENGGRWAFPIPEKYLYWLKRKKNIWAPQYVCHKNMMGLLDMYIYADNHEALEIVKGCADWFYEYTNDISRELMDDMMDMQETGGMMEHWANLYAITKDERHLELMRRYERPRLFEPVSRGEDVLTNLHANTQIPEILGAARAYEVTGEQRYRVIAENFWKLAVTERGFFATGGQSSGEVWTPPFRQASRLGRMTQEHCTVYHMMKLAAYLFSWTGDSQYADYWERNLYNGIFAQGYWESHNIFQLNESPYATKRLVAYYLPLSTGAVKQWGSETEDFWCCHCTLLQANAVHHRSIYYQAGDVLTAAQYLPSETSFDVGGHEVHVRQTEGDRPADTIRITPEAYLQQARPEHTDMVFQIHCEHTAAFTLRLRKPWWLVGAPQVQINGSPMEFTEDNKGFILVDRLWKDGDELKIRLKKHLSVYPLPDRPDTMAFMDGPVVLAGLCRDTQMLYGDWEHPEDILIPDDERAWGSWNKNYRTVGQPIDIKFKPLYDIGDEAYTVYFQVCDRTVE